MGCQPTSAGLSITRKRKLTDARRERAFQPSSELFPGNSLFSNVESRGGIRAGRALARPRRPKRCEPPELEVTSLPNDLLEDEDGSITSHVWVHELRRRRPSMEARLMFESIYPLIYWPVGIALGGWLFFEIAKRM